MEATEDAVFQAETLRGDVRDKFMDDVVRRMPGWVQMREHEQKAIITTVNSISCHVIRQVAEVIAHRGFVHMQVSTGEFTVKDGIKMKVGASYNVENVTKLAEHGGGEAILIFADLGDFFGQRAEAAFDKDEPELPIDEGQPAHDPETGEVLGQDAGDEGGNPLPDRGDLPEPPEDEEGDDEQDEDGEAEEAPAAPPRRRTRSRQPVDA